MKSKSRHALDVLWVRLRQRRDVDQLPPPVLIGAEAHLPLHQREQRVIFPDPTVRPRMPLRPSLPRQDVSRPHDFAVAALQPQKLWIRVSPVARRPALFLRRVPHEYRLRRRAPRPRALLRDRRARGRRREGARARAKHAPRFARASASASARASATPRSRARLSLSRARRTPARAIAGRSSVARARPPRPRDVARIEGEARAGQNARARFALMDLKFTEYTENVFGFATPRPRAFSFSRSAADATPPL